MRPSCSHCFLIPALLAGASCTSPSDPPANWAVNIEVSDSAGRFFPGVQVQLAWLPDDLLNGVSLTTDSLGRAVASDPPTNADSVLVIVNGFECGPYGDVYQRFALVPDGTTDLTVTVRRFGRASLQPLTLCGEAAMNTADAFLLALHIDSLSPQVAGTWTIAYRATRGTEQGSFIAVADSNAVGFVLTAAPGSRDCNPSYTFRAEIEADTLGPGRLTADGDCFASGAPLQLYEHSLFWFP